MIYLKVDQNNHERGQQSKLLIITQKIFLYDLK